MTKKEIQERQLQIMARMHEMQDKSREANNGLINFTEAEDIEFRSLVTESAGLSAEIKAMASASEAEQIRSREEKGKELRELIVKCGVEKRAESTTILAFKDTEAGNTNANLQAGGLIPVEILPIIDTKVPGIELPDDLKMTMGVTGNEIVPYSINDVKFTVQGEVTKVAEQALDFANVTTNPVRVAASVPVSFRAIDNAAFDIIAFITFKFQKGWAMFRALHVYAHGEYTKLQSPFGKVTPVELTMDDNIGENLAKEIAKMYDKGFEGDPEIIMDKTTEVALKFKKLIPGTTDSNRTVVEDGKCVGYPYTVSPFVNYVKNSAGVPAMGADRFIAIGHYDYLAMQIHGQAMFNVDAQSAEVFSRRTVVVSLALDMSMTELSSKVNGNTSGKPQAFKLIKLVEAEPTTT